MIELLRALPTGTWYSLQDRPDRMHIELTVLWLMQHGNTPFEWDSDERNKFKRI